MSVDGRRSVGGLTIFVPRNLEDAEPTMVCRVPTGDDEVCGRPFYPGEERAFQRHVGVCAREHAQAIHEQAPKRRMPVFDPENWDPEVRQHMREVGRTMRAEGRLEVKPSERAGF